MLPRRGYPSPKTATASRPRFCAIGDMGDTLIRAHGLHILGWRLGVFRGARGALAEGSIAIEATEEYRSVVDGVETFVGLDNADRLADKGLAQEYAATEPLDVAVVADPAHL